MNQNQLNAIGHKIRTQDNQMTEDPIFCVFEKESMYRVDPDSADGYEWYDHDASEVVDISEYDQSDLKDKLTDNIIEKIYYKKYDKFVNAHFTKESAENHIRNNGHNLNKPFIYVKSMYRCPEMITIRKFLKKQGAEE